MEINGLYFTPNANHYLMGTEEIIRRIQDSTLSVKNLVTDDYFHSFTKYVEICPNNDPMVLEVRTLWNEFCAKNINNNWQRNTIYSYIHETICSVYYSEQCKYEAADRSIGHVTHLVSGQKLTINLKSMQLARDRPWQQYSRTTNTYKPLLTIQT